MILVDTSAWIEFLRNTGSPVHLRLRAAVTAQEPLGIHDLVRLELCAGVRDEARAEALSQMLAGFRAVTMSSPFDHESAASLYRAARSSGETVRSLIDCLIAAAALRLDARLLARDRDYEVLAGVSDLRLVLPATPGSRG